MDSDDEIQQQYNANNYYSENDSILLTEDTESIYTFNLDNRKKYSKRLDDLKMADKGYYKEIRVIDGTRVKIEMYSTPSCQGKLIRDAVTGESLPYRVGSLDEHLFFSVLRSDLSNGKDLITFFYSSPEEYERHQLCQLSNEYKEMWREKMFIRKKQIELQNKKNKRVMSRTETGIVQEYIEVK
jgi:hypothetical protein